MSAPNRSRWIAPGLWAVLIETLTSWPRLPSVGPQGSDKLGHLAMFAVFAFLVARALEPGRPSLRTVAIVAAAMAAWAALDEVHQMFIPGRSGEFADWVADVAGAGLGLLARRWINASQLNVT
ncbi:MAG: VanZ family protein [Gemmatimonadetes bacterium]|nr:VanZ family protein [Gemmatimonadota bacterium]